MRIVLLAATAVVLCVSSASAQLVLPRLPEAFRGKIGLTYKESEAVKPEQYAEVVLDGYPGRLFTGRVQNVIDISGAGQLTATGELPEDLGSAATARFAVRIRLDDGDTLRLPAGSHGLAAIFTQHVPVAGIPVMVLMRMQSWLNYVM
ncbi:MAG: hypothetical protein KDA79_23475 [Planctomycetaceae bacterium]|nr:hypothetical protein [Planctomycetaceae bacterium]